MFRSFTMLQTKSPSFQFDIARVKRTGKKHGIVNRFQIKGIIIFRPFPPDPGLVRLLRLVPTFGIHSDISYIGKCHVVYPI
jgi:hypothetical protein